jgi:hypothetical protein
VLVRLSSVAVAAAVALAGAAVAAPASPTAPPGRTVSPSPLVPDPVVTGPTTGGVRTGEPFGRSMVPLDEGWVEEEFFFSGTARSVDETAADAAYTSRILVRRPADPKRFNGTVVLDWDNVTLAFDKDVSWAPMHRTAMDRGYAMVSVAAQRLSIEASPLALKQYDPVRYGSLSHPGDDYSYDIFSQAAEAVLDPKVLGALRPKVAYRLAVGASQSASRLKTYINDFHDRAEVFDGYGPQIIGAEGVERDVAPTLWVNSQAEVPAEPVEPDSGLFRLWELAGPAHTSYGSDRYQDAVLQYSASNGNVGSYDPETALGWGYQAAPGECLTANYLSSTWAWSAQLVALDRWVRTGKAPAPQPRAARDAEGTRLFDERGNMLGGVRLPYVDAPIASYYTGLNRAPGADPCAVVGGAAALKGTTRVFDAATLVELYPTPQAYLKAFEASVQRNLKAGTLLSEGAADLRQRATVAAEWLAANG